MKKKTWQEFFSSILFLKIVFGLLLLIVIILGTVIITQNKESEKKTNMSIPVLGTSSDFEFGIDVKELEKEKGKRYTFKIVNYHDEELIQEDIPYEIHIYNPTESTFKITRDNQEKTLHKDESLVIEGSLAGKQKIEDYYTVQIVNYQKESSEEFLYIHIFSEKV